LAELSNSFKNVVSTSPNASKRKRCSSARISLTIFLDGLAGSDRKDAFGMGIFNIA
jgi:hypothetical protein